MQRDATANWTERRMRITVSCTKVTCLTCSRVFSSPRVYYRQVDSCRKSVIFNLAILPKTSAVLLAVVCSKFVGSFCCPYLVNSLPSVGDQGGELCQVPMAFAHCLSHLESPFGLCLHLRRRNGYIRSEALPASCHPMVSALSPGAPCSGIGLMYVCILLSLLSATAEDFTILQQQQARVLSPRRRACLPIHLQLSESAIAGRRKNGAVLTWVLTLLTSATLRLEVEIEQKQASFCPRGVAVLLLLRCTLGVQAPSTVRGHAVWSCW